MVEFKIFSFINILVKSNKKPRLNELFDITDPQIEQTIDRYIKDKEREDMERNNNNNFQSQTEQEEELNTKINFKNKNEEGIVEQFLKEKEKQRQSFLNKKPKTNKIGGDRTSQMTNEDDDIVN